MKHGIIEAWKNLLKLFRFLLWYVIAVAAVFYILPIAGLFLEGRYDAMTSSVKIYFILGFFLLIALWQAASWRGRLKVSAQVQDSDQVLDSVE